MRPGMRLAVSSALFVAHRIGELLVPVVAGGAFVGRAGWFRSRGELGPR